jgi:uncharacterized repeat protein (TIGR01451 family)
MKTHKHLLIVPLAGLLCLTSCSTSSPDRSTSMAVKPPAVVESTSAYLVTVSKTAPRIVSVGDEFAYELSVTAQADVSEVTVVDTLPADASFVSADPVGTRDGNKLTWKLDNLSRGEKRAFKVTLTAQKEGELVNSAKVSATFAGVSVTNMVAKPQLAINKTGPVLAQVGQEVVYTVRVENTGNTTAKDIVVTDTVPEGLSSASGQKELTFKVGDLEPGASKNIPITLKAEKRGKVSNKAVAASGRGGKVEAETSTTIVQSGVKIEKTTKDKELFVNRAASYEIVVSNTGDTDLSGVVVTDTAAAETVIAAAEGATVSGSTATWNVGELKAGEKRSFTVKVLSKSPGRFYATASVATAQGLKGSAQDYTEWKGVTGVLVEMVDDPDPIQVGETSVFTIRVANQGTTIPIKDLNIVATLPEELELVPGRVSDAGVISGRTITWPTVPGVDPRTSVVRTFTVKGVRAGDARSKASITTSVRKEPIEEFESTTVY